MNPFKVGDLIRNTGEGYYILTISTAVCLVTKVDETIRVRVVSNDNGDIPDVREFSVEPKYFKLEKRTRKKIVIIG